MAAYVVTLKDFNALSTAASKEQSLCSGHFMHQLDWDRGARLKTSEAALWVFPEETRAC